MADGSFRTDTDAFAQDWAALGAWLVSAGHDFDPSLTPKQFSGGVGNFNYLITIDGAPAVLRRPPPGPRPPGANDMGREFRVLSTLGGHEPLAPKAIAFCEDETVLGAPFLISEYREGRILRGDDFESDEATHKMVGEMMVRTLARFHGHDVAALGLSDFGKPEGFSARTAAGWRKRLFVGTDDAPPNEAVAIADWLDAKAPPDTSRPRLLHNDFKLDNIILDPEDLSRPVAVLDWDQATLGEPLFDLATLLSYWVEADDPPVLHALKQMPTARPGFPSRREAVELYAALRGEDVASIVYFRVLAQFKLAVVLLQLHARWRRNPERFARFQPLDFVAGVMFEFTADLINEKRF